MGAREAGRRVQEEEMKHPKTIKRHLKELRGLIDASSDPVERRIAYAMEIAVRWATEKTFDWPGLAKEAIHESAILKRELNLS